MANVLRSQVEQSPELRSCSNPKQSEVIMVDDDNDDEDSEVMKQLLLGNVLKRILSRVTIGFGTRDQCTLE